MRYELADGDGDDYVQLGAKSAELYANSDRLPGDTLPVAEGRMRRVTDRGALDGEALRMLASGAITGLTNQWPFRVDHIMPDHLNPQLRMARAATQGVLFSVN